MNSVFLFYFHIILTGVTIAAASTSFATLIGAPPPKALPVSGPNGALAGPLTLWLLAGPIALMRIVVQAFSRTHMLSFWSIGALAGALLWAFCLGVAVLELTFRLFWA